MKVCVFHETKNSVLYIRLPSVDWFIDIQMNQPTRCSNFSGLSLSFKYSRPARPRPTALLPLRSYGQPEAASAVDKLLMMGMRKPETCWAVFKRQAINLNNCCIWSVDSVECMMMHEITSPKFTDIRPAFVRRIIASKHQDLFIPRHSVIFQWNRIFINTATNALKLAYVISLTLLCFRYSVLLLKLFLSFRF
jgi:hypothetical protein